MYNHAALNDIERNAETFDIIERTEGIEKADDERKTIITFDRRSFIPKWGWILAIASIFIEIIPLATFIMLQPDPESFLMLLGNLCGGPSIRSGWRCL